VNSGPRSRWPTLASTATPEAHAGNGRRDDRQDLVSVIMPAYRAEAHIAEAVASVLEQTWEHLELIVIDDGSDDGTLAVLSRFRDPRLRVISRRHRGVAAARNAGLSVARGAYIAWHDADDVAAPTRLAALLSALHPGTGFAHSDLVLIDDVGTPMDYWQGDDLPQERVLQCLLRRGTPYNNNTMLVRAELLAGIWFDESVMHGSDTEFVARFAPYSRGVHVPEPLILYRRWSGSLSASCTPEERVAFVRSLLSTHHPVEFCPEVSRALPPSPSADAVARALNALSVRRRGMPELASEEIDVALLLETPPDIRLFLWGIAHLVTGDVDRAYAVLTRAPSTALTENYLGEIEVLWDNVSGAAQHLRRALALDPHYSDPAYTLHSLARRHGESALRNGRPASTLVEPADQQGAMR
jgi:hypothetical protein